MSAGDCWAVGFSGLSGPSEPLNGEPLIEHYAGSSWAIVGTPNPSRGSLSSLSWVTCVSAEDCWAVGASGPAQGVSGPSEPLIEHYAGSSWAIVGTPNPSAGQLNGVTCVSAGDCWAVGFSAGPDEPLIEHDTGSGWAIVGTPNPSSGTLLTVVTCASARDCWAFGGGAGGDVGQTPLIGHYTGSVWAIVGTPNPSPA